MEAGLIDPISAEYALEQLRQNWLDKLWCELFNGEQGGLMSPGQIRREGRSRIEVRQMEMAAIIEAEEDINRIHHGEKGIDDRGNIIDTPPVDHIATHAIIEQPTLNTDLDPSLSDTSSLLRSAVREIAVRDIERALNLRRLTILAESEILGIAPCPVSSRPVNVQWLARWRELAQDVFNEEIQVIWARMLVSEVAAPGSFSLDLMGRLALLSANDIDMIQLAAKYVLGDFIYDARRDYFNTDFHRQLFDELGDLGLFTGEYRRREFASQHRERFRYLFTCHRKAILVEGVDQSARILLPVMVLSRVGRQLFRLTDTQADLAYLYKLGAAIKVQGFVVRAGDWQVVNGKGRFTSRLRL